MTALTRAQIRPRPTASRWSLKTTTADALAFLIALTTAFSVNLVGSLPVAEIIVLPLAPIFIIFCRHRPIPPVLKAIFFLMGLWLFGQVLTDIYRHTAAVDWMRGNSTIVFFAIDLALLNALLSGNERRKVVFMVGGAIGSLLLARFAPPRLARDEPWKFGYSGGTILLVILISCFFYKHRHYIVVYLLFAGIIAVNLLENYRSPVLILLLAMVLVLPIIPERIGRLKLLPRAGSFLRVAVLAGLAIGGGWIASSLVHWVTTTGIIGEEAQAKNQEETQGSGILLGGRPEILVSSRAVMESPILGHGSWARDYRYVEMLNDIRIEQGKAGNLEDLEESTGGVIPAHSHLMGAWVSAGILGAVFWTFVMWLLIRATIKVSVTRSPLAPVYGYLMISLIWAVAFSPFSGTSRMGEGFLIVVIVDNLKASRSVKKLPLWMRGAWTRRGARNSKIGPKSAAGSRPLGAQAKSV
jgi:hypothetical protein